ncbi:MAG: hypothetical protein K6G23_00855 [Lachnospiraceae bacterium]|nr:hypothetical protein [Lachnospiraceae bacterium]
MESYLRVSGNLKKIARDCVFIIVIVALTETFLFNISYWRNLGNEPKDVTGQMAISGAEQVDASTGTYRVTDAEGVVFYTEGLQDYVHSIYFGIDFEDEIVDYDISITDDGNAATPYGLSTQQLLSWVAQSHYMTLHPYGNIRTFKVVFRASAGSLFTVQSIQFQPQSDFRLRWGRMILLAGLLVLIRLFVLAGQGTTFQINQKLFISCFTLASVFVVTTLMQIVGGGWRTYAYISEYADLARSFANGSVALDYQVDPRLLALENPYDYTTRATMELEAYWDTAFYQGNYYVYFGVVPVVLLYLPYYLITGRDLNNVDCATVFAILTVLGSIWLVREVMKRFFTDAPFWMFPVISILIGFQEPLVYLYSRGDIYDIPILAANGFLLLGLAAWIHALNESHRENATTTIYMCIGSLCMALVAGCRPQMVLASILAIPLFRTMVFEQRALFSRKRMIRTGAFVLPFVLVAAALMAYNAARFGSPFDFGANYNLTTNDMTRRGMEIDRIPGGVFYLLFQPPVILATFPFIRTALNSSFYMGKTILEANYGGVFFLNMGTWFLFAIGYVKDLLKKKKAYAICLTLCALTIVICAVDAMVAGMVPRYSADFAVLLMLAAGFVMLTVVEESRGSRLYKVVTGVIMVMLLFTLFVDAAVTLNAVKDENSSLIPKAFYTAKSYLTFY